VRGDETYIILVVGHFDDAVRVKMVVGIVCVEARVGLSVARSADGDANVDSDIRPGMWRGRRREEGARAVSLTPGLAITSRRHPRTAPSNSTQ
jgi:hypothetical protein